MDEQTGLGLIDSHAHIQGREYAGEVDAVVRRARAAGVEKIIVVGGAGELSSNEAAVQLAQSHAELYATVGMHPHDAKDVSDGDLRKLQALTERPKVVAVGETGLDYYYNHSPRDVQCNLFTQFIHMACETDLPIVVHEREAAQDVAALLRCEGKGKVRGVIHCFTGNYEAACAYLDLGLYLSFTGIITFTKADSLRDVVQKVPLERILLETDSPYLTPVPYRGKRNEPAYVQLVAEAVSEIKGIALEKVADVTTRNVRYLFNI
jgi:TatD DNase family protein